MQFKRYLTAVSFIFLSLISYSFKFDTDSLEQSLHLTELPSEKVKLLNLLAAAYAEKDLVKSTSFADQAIFIANSINDARGKAEAQYYKSKSFIAECQYDKGFELLTESHRVFSQSGEKLWQAKVSVRLSFEHKRRFEYEKALNLLFKASNIFNELKKENNLAYTVNEIGGIYYDQENFNKAFEYFQNALTLYLKTGNKRGISSAYNNIGEIYRIKNKFDKALEHYKKALEISNNLNRQELFAVIYNNMGNIFLTLEQFDSAYHYMSLSEKISNNLNNPLRIGTAYISLGNFYLKTGDTTNSLIFFQKGYAIAKQHSYLSDMQEATFGISKVYEITENFKKAYFFYYKYKILSDSVVNISNYEKITQIEMNRLFESEQKMNKIARQKTNMSYFTLAITLIFVFVLLVLLYGRQKIKIKHSHSEAENLQLEYSQLKDELEFKNRELTTKVMYLLRKNELLSFLSEKLLKAKTLFSKENEKKVEEIIFSLQENVDKNIWDVFEQRFQDVHIDFYRKLMSEFPNLSKNDKKLCALIRLNLSTKEISSLTHQNLNSIEVARTRLRKKLNISNTDISLNRFLSNL
ncbi:MAG: tetratricopeptide repeat protein [Bacteroidales bacterium]|nr:tetratricopeptide repeat protein [Bacteroidales bacterium]